MCVVHQSFYAHASLLRERISDDKKTKSSVDSYLDCQTLPLSIEKPPAALHGSQPANRKVARVTLS